MTSKLTITREQVRERLDYIESLNAKGVETAVHQQQFELACLRELLSCLESELVAWTDEQCLEFLSIAFRHARIIGDLEMDDIRDGIRIVNNGRAAMVAAARQEVTTER